MYDLSSAHGVECMTVVVVHCCSVDSNDALFSVSENTLL